MFEAPLFGLEVRADGGCLHCEASAGERCRDNCRKLPEAEAALAIRLYETTPQLCLIHDELPAPTLKAWLDYCQWCFEEIGAVPSGT